MTFFPVPVKASVYLHHDLFNPHSVRNTLVQLGELRCESPEEFKAWSRNLGHDGVLTTFTSYGQVASGRQGQIIRRLAEPRGSDVSRLAQEIAKAIQRA
jgi:hypothetical protein